ncbi:MAG: hypothetical protein IT266_09465 [Saprospiraceae bacterium]|nr:hypothetical protein [Saprospiraceae bacterium]
MRQLSSGLTFALAIFLPVWWTVFFGCFSLFTVFTPAEDLPLSNPYAFRMAICAFTVCGFALLYGMFMRLKRVEWGDGHFYITNYFRTAKIDDRGLQRAERKRMLGISFLTLHFPGGTSFGKQVRILCSQDNEKFIRSLIVKQNGTGPDSH